MQTEVIKESSHVLVSTELEQSRKASMLKLTFQSVTPIGQNGRNALKFVDLMELNFVLEFL